MGPPNGIGKMMYTIYIQFYDKGNGEELKYPRKKTWAITKSEKKGGRVVFEDFGLEKRENSNLVS